MEKIQVKVISIEISDVLKQYEEKYPDFVFLGPSPIDFDSVNVLDMDQKSTCVWPELCHFDLKQHISNGTKRVGMVFNLDKHYQDGSHWVSMFLDIPSKKLFILIRREMKFREIESLIHKIQKQANQLGISLIIDNNANIQHQIHNTGVGVILYFIISLLTKKHNVDYLRKLLYEII